MHRAVFPIDPGPMHDIAGQNGLRMWYGEHHEPMLLAPAGEYAIEPSQPPSPQRSERQNSTTDSYSRMFGP